MAESRAEKVPETTLSAFHDSRAALAGIGIGRFTTSSPPPIG